MAKAVAGNISDPGKQCMVWFTSPERLIQAADREGKEDEPQNAHMQSLGGKTTAC